MASSQTPLAAHRQSGVPKVALRLTPTAHQHEQNTGDVIPGLLRKHGPGGGLKHSIKPLITSQLPDTVAQLVSRAAQLDPTYVPVDFGSWYQVEFDPEEVHSLKGDDGDSTDATTELHRLAHRLHGDDDVVSAHLLHRDPPPPPTVNWQNDPRSKNQGYLEPAPNGIDAKYAWTCTGGDGAGTNVVDLEYGWDLNHEDLVAANVTLISGTNSTENSTHGTSVLGEILMVDNKIGGIGVAPSAKGRVVSSLRPDIVNVADAILDAIAKAPMHWGDVLLLEAQEWNWAFPGDVYQLLPVEVTQANYDAISTATSLGITVIEAGANGSNDLDKYITQDSPGKQILNRSSKDFRDSKAVMVGGASSAVPHQRMSWSNYGSRIDVYAWGENIDTSTADAANATNHSLYTTAFNGTSGASPIITGAALIVQGIANATRGKLFSSQVRNILAKGGTASGTPASDKIGVMPNLKAIIDGKYIASAPDMRPKS